MGFVARFAFAVAAMAAALASAAQTYEEPDSVKARFPDPPVRYQTPGFAPGRSDFTTHEELIAWLAELSTRAASVRVRMIGESQEGRPARDRQAVTSTHTTGRSQLNCGEPTAPDLYHPPPSRS